MSNDISEREIVDSNDFERKALPSGLNVLTILSIIWCVIQFLWSIWTFFTAKMSYEQKDKVIEQMKSAKIPSWAKPLMPDMTHFEEALIKNYENRLPILIMSLVSVFLCFYGVMQMRKLKKQGYLLYVIGELLPFVTAALFIGAFTLVQTGSILFACIAVLFIIMYTTYRKNLIY